MNEHIGPAVVGFVVFVWLALITAAAGALQRTHKASSLLAWRRDLAVKFGLGAVERFSQHPIVLSLQLWALRVFTLSALLFSCWHFVGALIRE